MCCRLCKDYKWRGVDHVIEQVQEMREVRTAKVPCMVANVDLTCVQNIDRGWVVNPSAFATVLPTEPCLDGAVRQRAIALAASGNPHVQIASVLEDRLRKRLESLSSVDPDSTQMSDSSDVEFLPGRFPRIPFRYPVVPFGPIKVVVFDIFGTIMVSACSLTISSQELTSMYEGSRTGYTERAELLVRSLSREALYDAGPPPRPVPHT